MQDENIYQEKQLVFTKSYNPTSPSWSWHIFTIAEWWWLQYGWHPSFKWSPHLKQCRPFSMPIALAITSL